MRRSLPILLLFLVCLRLDLSAQVHAVIVNETGGNPQYIQNFADTQVFTLPEAGLLSHVQVNVSGGAGATLTYDLCATTPSVNDPAGAPLTTSPIFTGTTTLPASSGYRWVDLDLAASGYVASAGEFLAIRIRPLAGCHLQADASDPYAGGSLWLDNGGAPSIYQGKDLAFRLYLIGGLLTDSGTYAEDFESGARGWSVDNGLWELGTPAQTYISAANSGGNCWMTDLDADYPLLTTSAVVSSWFDCSGLSQDPRITFAMTDDVGTWNDGCRLEIDLDDGQGWRRVGDDDWYDASPSINGPTYFGMTGIFWGGLRTPWKEMRNELAGVVGRSRFRLRFLFVSDSAYGHEGFAFDDLRIEAPKIVVDAATPYFEDFERPGDGYYQHYALTSSQSTLTGPVWQRGTPTKAILGPPRSGVSCWATDLDGPYPSFVFTGLTSPWCDFSALSEDPVLEFAMIHEFANATGLDGLRVELDLGNGVFYSLGSLADWYDGTLSSNFGAGGVGWTGTSNGWRILRHRLTGAAGLAHVRFQFLFSSNIGGTGAGALIDDVRVFVPTFKGTESTLGDDIRMQVMIDGARELGSADAYDVQPGEAIDVHSFSSEGDLVGGEYYLVAEIFGTGGTYANVAPEVWISLGPGSVLLQGGVQPPFYVPMQMSPYGATLSYYYGGGAAGFSCRLQALVFKPTAMNGLYASSDAFELKFQ